MRTKSGLLSAIAILASIVLATPAQAAPIKHSEVVNFLTGKFVTVSGNTFLEGFTPGTPNLGFSLEAIAQLSQSGTTKLTAIKKWALTSNAKVKGVSGLAAKWLYTSALVKYPNASARAVVENALVAKYKKLPLISKLDNNTFNIAWDVLALTITKHPAEAKNAALALARLKRNDGGYGSDLSVNTTTSSADATGIALMAFQATNQKTFAKSAITWLKANIKTGNHWESYGDVDVNGTAYAIMGLQSAGQSVTAARLWLTHRISPSDGGVTSAWSAGAGDTFASAQSYLPIIGTDYVKIGK